MSNMLDWTLLFEQEAPRLMRFLRRFGPHVSAEDIKQDAFARLCASKSEDITSPRAYLFRIARNLALNELKRRHTDPTRFVLDANAFDRPSPSLSPEDDVIAEEEAARLRAALSRICEKKRLALVLFKIERLSHKEIGQRLGVSHRTAERYIADAIAQCHEILSADGR